MSVLHSKTNFTDFCMNFLGFSHHDQGKYCKMMRKCEKLQCVTAIKCLKTEFWVQISDIFTKMSEIRTLKFRFQTDFEKSLKTEQLLIV